METVSSFYLMGFGLFLIGFSVWAAYRAFNPKKARHLHPVLSTNAIRQESIR